MSAHWESAPLSLSAPAEHAPLVYDFGGFHPRYYTVRYDTPDATALARRVAGALPDGELVHRHVGRGLDHGARLPLMAMYPLADIPVLQLSMPTQDPDQLLDIGARLRPLTEEGVLVIGSGFMTHGLPFSTRARSKAKSRTGPGTSTPGPPTPSRAAPWTNSPRSGRGRPVCRTPIRPSTTTSRCSSPLGAAAHPDRPVRATVEGYTIGFSKRSFQTAV